MSWITKLYETYENCSDLVGVSSDNVLLPICHSTQNSHIEIVIDYEGNFLRAATIDKDYAETIIPVSENSASRSSGIAPHPLCDKLIYIAGDYDKFIRESKKFYDYYLEYISELKKWVNSDFSDAKVSAIYTYLSKESAINDLVNYGILVLEDDYLVTSIKIAGFSQVDAFVRFRVEKFGDTSDESAVWKDAKVYKSFIDYYCNSFSSKEICYATGEKTYCSDKHPGRIRHAADKSKLISANDSSGYIYRGRFNNREEANQVSYEVSQKAHNMLKWLISRQGIRFGELVYIVWGTHCIDVPDIFKDTIDILTWNLDDVIEDEDIEVINASMRIVDTDEQYSKNVKKAIWGQEFKISNNEDIIILGVEAATTGRLSVVYYKEMKGSSFYENITNWHSTCIWEFDKYRNNKMISFVGAPAIRDIVSVAYANEINGKLDVKDKLEKNTVYRLIPCILGKKQIPYDIVSKAVNNASRANSFSKSNRKKMVNIACAIIRKHYYDKNGEVYSLALQEERNDRSYLYGRLLAIAHMAERSSQKGLERDTNAERYMNAFQKHPFSTWLIVNNKLQPYLKSMRGLGDFYRRMIADITNQFVPEEFENNQALNGTFLLGYNCQLKARGKKIISNIEEEESK